MKYLTRRQTGVLVLCGLAGWALCALTIGVGMAVTTEEAALLIHAVTAPIFFAIISWIFHTRFGFVRPWEAAAVFLAVVVLLDASVVAGLVLRSYEMFGSFVGTWLPFALIFFSSWLVGEVAQASGESRARA